jgi:hypothetical protein
MTFYRVADFLLESPIFIQLRKKYLEKIRFKNISLPNEKK